MNNQYQIKYDVGVLSTSPNITYFKNISAKNFTKYLAVPIVINSAAQFYSNIVRLIYVSFKFNQFENIEYAVLSPKDLTLPHNDIIQGLLPFLLVTVKDETVPALRETHVYVLFADALGLEERGHRTRLVDWRALDQHVLGFGQPVSARVTTAPVLLSLSPVIVVFRN